MMTTTNNNMNMAHEVEGPDPVRWPGENYELLTDMPGFVLPERAAKILTIADGSGVPWKVNRPERSNVEEIHTLEKEGFPLEIQFAGPDKYTLSVALPQGASAQKYNGLAGWLKNAREDRAMDNADVAKAKALGTTREILQLNET